MRLKLKLNMSQRLELLERLRNRCAVDRRTGCWNWQLSTNTHGYGQIRVGDRILHAHRVMWDLTRGEIPDGPGYHGICICHHCDNKKCIRPTHLFAGTQRENVDDAMSKGLVVMGERQWKAKLTAQAVRLIRFIRNERLLTLQQISDLVGVTPSAISHAATGYTWASV